MVLSVLHGPAHIDKECVAPYCEMHRLERLADARSQDAYSRDDIELGAVRTANDLIASGIEILVFAPGHRRTVEVRTGVSPSVQPVAVADNEHRVVAVSQ